MKLLASLNPANWIRSLARQEVRSTLADPDGFLERYFTGAPVTSGVIVNERTALSIAAVYMAVRVISEAVASLPCPVYKHLRPRGRERLREHGVYRLLNEAPNPEMHAYLFRQTLLAHCLLWGNAYAEIERRGDGTPTALHILRPDRVYPIRDLADQRVVYRYWQPGQADVTLEKEDVFHLRGLSFDGLVGYAPVTLARQSLGLSIAAETYGASFFGNSGLPAGAIKHPGKLSEPAFKHLRESWQETHGGPRNAGKVAILEEGASFEATTVPPEDMQFLQTREFSVEEVARWFNLSPHKLNDLRRATNNNIEQQSIDFVVHSIRPWLVNFEAEATMKLLLPQERESLYIEHLVDGLLRGDLQGRFNAYAIGRQWGWLSANDICEMENRNPIPGGDVYLVPLNMQPAEVLHAGIQAVKDGSVLPQPPGTVQAPVPPPAPAKGMNPPDDANPDDADLVAQRAMRATRALAVRNAHLPVLTDAIARIVRRETEVLRRAVKKPATLSAFIDKFYGEHREYLAQALRPALCSYRLSLQAAAGSAAAPNLDDIDQQVSGLLEEARGEVRAAIAGANGHTAQNLEALLVHWETQKPQRLADRLLDLVPPAPAPATPAASAAAAELRSAIETVRALADRPPPVIRIETPAPVVNLTLPSPRTRTTITRDADHEISQIVEEPLE